MFFVYECPVVPTVFIEKSSLSLLNYVAPLLKFNYPYICLSNKPKLLITYHIIYMYIYVCVYVCVYISQWNREKMCIYIHTLSFQFRWHETSNFVLPQIYFGYCKSFEFPYKFYINSI